MAVTDYRYGASMRLRRAIAIFLPALAAASIALVFACSGDDTIVSVIDASADQTSGNGQAVKVQILAINDFHGNLEPPTGTGGVVLADGNDPEIGDAGVLVDASGRDAATKQVPAGGAAYLAAHIAQLKSANPSNTAIVSAGDLTGASPLVSSLFHDEPAVLVMNAIGLDFNGVGNHEFDHGVPELRRLQYGGCHPDDCADGGSDYPGARYSKLAPG